MTWRICNETSSLYFLEKTPKEWQHATPPKSITKLVKSLPSCKAALEFISDWLPQEYSHTRALPLSRGSSLGFEAL